VYRGILRIKKTCLKGEESTQGLRGQTLKQCSEQVRKGRSWSSTTDLFNEEKYGYRSGLGGEKGGGGVGTALRRKKKGGGKGGSFQGEKQLLGSRGEKKGGVMQ